MYLSLEKLRMFDLHPSNLKLEGRLEQLYMWTIASRPKPIEQGFRGTLYSIEEPDLRCVPMRWLLNLNRRFLTLTLI